MLITLDTLDKVVKELKALNKKIVFTNGCFDILHAGHVRYLAQAKRLGDVMILGLNTDSSVHRIKGPTRPINCKGDRAEVLSALKSIDYVVLFDEETPINLISTIVPDFLVKGGDYIAEEVVGYDVVKNNGGETVIIPLLEGRSTTKIIEKISK
jgi:rfaE bifunctional protein nucleotidyltransferase chain/domain